MRSFITVALVWSLAACQAPGPMAPVNVHSRSEVVDFNGMRFEIKAASRVSHIANWLGQLSACSGMCTLVTVTVVNKTGQPLPMHFQPAFNLIGSDGARYEPNQLLTMQVNMNRPGRVMPGANMNPNMPIDFGIVFEVPEDEHKLQVIVPTRAKVGFGGSIVSGGPYLLFSLAQD